MVVALTVDGAERESDLGEVTSNSPQSSRAISAASVQTSS